MEWCTAKAKVTQEQCKNSVVRGRSKCRLHGGATPRGVASPHFKHGRYSQDLPTQISASLEEGRLPLNFLQLTEEISLCDSRLQELTEQLGFAEEDEHSGVWQEIMSVADSRRRLVETELKHLKASSSWIAIDQALAIIGRVTYVVKQQLDLYVDATSARNVLLGVQLELSKSWAQEGKPSNG